MRKTIIALSIVGVLSLVAFGVVMAQDTTPEFQPGSCPNCLFDGAEHPLHEYMSAAMAEALGITVDEFNAYREEGLTFYQIAAELDLDVETLAETFAQVKSTALEQALADGAISQEQYQFMLDHAGFGGHFGGGMGFGGGLGFNGGHGGRHNSGKFGPGMGGGQYGSSECPFNQSGEN